jgi:hypothetical protein
LEDCGCYPVQYWKIAAALNSAGELFATAYLASQADVIARLGIEADVPFSPFKLFQVKVSEIERLTGRLKSHLESQGCFVVLFDAINPEGDIEVEDVDYTDILLACTYNLIESLKSVNPKPVLNWLNDRWVDLQDLGLTKIELGDLKAEAGLKDFFKLSTSVSLIPSDRRKIRQLITPHTKTLLQALNEFIRDAKTKLPEDRNRIVVIADNLDRIAYVRQSDGRSNHDEIFLDRGDRLKGLDCHLVYTIPVSMIYSNRANDLRGIYGSNPRLLPMIAMRDHGSGQPSLEGVNKFKEIIANRIKLFAPNARLEADIFESSEVLEQLCLMSGGYIRELFQLIQESIHDTDVLPISAKSLRRAITDARDIYRRTVDGNGWEVLAKVAKTRRIVNDDIHRSLLFQRCILEYRYVDDEGDIQPWYNVHPLIKGIQEFKDELIKVQP